MAWKKEMLAVFVAFSLVGCGQGVTEPHGDEPEPTAGAMELRTYEVPGRQSDAVRAALSRVLHPEEGQTPAGRASVTPDGLLLVLGSAGVQEGVVSLIEQVEAGGSAQERASIVTELWIVAGVPGETGEIPPALAQLSDALTTVEQHEGPHRFLHVEKLSMRVQENEHGRVHGEIELEQYASVVGERVIGNFEISGLGSSLDTNMAIHPDQVVILGTSSVGVDHLSRHVDPVALGDARRVGVFYVIRCSVERPGGSQ